MYLKCPVAQIKWLNHLIQFSRDIANGFNTSICILVLQKVSFIYVRINIEKKNGYLYTIAHSII